MFIRFGNKRIEKICLNTEQAERTYDRDMANKIHQRIDEISAADSVEMLVKHCIGRCHPLSNNRKGQYAMDLVHPYRLVFTKLKEEVEIALIKENVDYH